MKISDFLFEDCCVMDLKAVTKEDAIREIAEKIAGTGRIKNKTQFVKEILIREQMSSTGIGHGLAIPHARTETVDDFVMGFGRSRQGIDFNSVDKEKAKLIFLMGASTTDLNLYLRLLAQLSKNLMNKSFRDELLKAASGSEIVKIFRNHENATPA